MKNGFRTVVRLPAPPEAIYRAWLSSREHSAMTGSKATVSARAGGKFTVSDGYIRGRNLKLKPHWSIVQAWRTTEFAKDDPDSRLELHIHPWGRDGSKLVLIHTDIPPGQAESYRSGWREYYFEPMKAYFSGRRAAARKSPEKAATKRTAKKTKRASARRRRSKRKTARPRARR